MPRSRMKQQRDTEFLEAAQKVSSKDTKEKGKKEKLKQSRKDTVAAAAPVSKTQELPPSGVQTKSGVMDYTIHGVIQQYVSVQKKEKRAVLSFVLNQFKYSGECQILILVNTLQEAAGLKTALSASASFSLALMTITEQNTEFEQFAELKNTCGIITLETLLSDINISYANYLIVLDMPEDLDPYLERTRGLRSVTYFATSPEEVQALQALEARFTIKMRQMSCLGDLARTERQNALKMKLQSLG
eukprot:CAMPEP_0169351524 /NCGR_PEP_ID=MMETSP1017-20121227/24839_1 /TAXON_ID=342587 /ORGANISM="Karlodinium micrum, Strain CCMP2283" /LENGTH=244 /DNA_ID=CAMNT_0009447819 /DNA_START=181 /DNA_END=914 /DNA_ORIENTATION=-